MKNIVMLLGAPGSGKGTVAKILNTSFALAHISTGDLLREEIKNKTELGLKAEGLMSKGILVDDTTVTNMLKARIQQPDCDKGFVLDGFPRTLVQLNLLQQVLNDIPNCKLTVVQIDIAEDIIIKRISGRYSCSNCGKIYNEFWINPTQKGVCDDCGSTDFTKRKDDTVEVIKDRLSVYKQQTLPIIDYYKNLNLLHSIQGDLGKESILQWFKNNLV